MVRALTLLMLGKLTYPVNLNTVIRKMGRTQY